jgi:hypothetical protein
MLNKIILFKSMLKKINYLIKYKMGVRLLRKLTKGIT